MCTAGSSPVRPHGWTSRPRSPWNPSFKVYWSTSAWSHVIMRVWAAMPSILWHRRPACGSTGETPVPPGLEGEQPTKQRLTTHQPFAPTRLRPPAPCPNEAAPSSPSPQWGCALQLYAPTGLRPPAQGCDEVATLGPWTSAQYSTPTGLRPRRQRETQPFQGWIVRLTRFPRVAAARQLLGWRA